MTHDFRCADVALVRAALGSAAAADEFAGEGDVAALEAAAKDGLLREAVVVASPSLDAAWDKALFNSGMSAAKLRRTAHAVERYRLRFSSRATPFGLMAGVAAASFGPRTRVRWGSHHVRNARVDLEWLLGLVDRLEREPDVLRTARVVTNDLAFVRDGRLVVPCRSSLPPLRAATERSVRRTPAVAFVTRRACGGRPPTFADLEHELRERYPAADPARCTRLLVDLVEAEVLLTDLRPPLTAADPLDHVLTRLREADELPLWCRDLAGELAAVRDDLAEYVRTPLGGGRASWKVVTDRMRKLSEGERLIQVDVGLDAEVHLGQTVREEAEELAQTMWRISAGLSVPVRLGEYHHEFVERYSVGRPVPLLELLDPDVGLGAPAEYRFPPSHRMSRSAPTASTRDVALLALAHEAAYSGALEVLLDDTLLERLSGEGVPPPSFDLLTQLLADSPEAIDRGDFRLLAEGGGVLGGAFAGRFAPLLGVADERFAEILTTAPTDNPDAVRAQLVVQPFRGPAGAVAQVPRRFDHVITIAAFADQAEGQLGLADLAVVADADRLALVSASLGTEIVPTTPSMLATANHSSNVARFLDDLGRFGGRQPHWYWGTAVSLPYLPRVRRGRSILASARWHPAAPELAAAPDFDSWCELFAEWRARWRVPDRVRMYDPVTCLHFHLDLTAISHLSLLRHDLGRNPDIRLEEVPGGGEFGAGWLGFPGTQGHANEIVFSVQRTEQVRTRPVKVAPRRERRVFRPGSEWLYAKVYCSRERQNAILVDHLPLLLWQLPSAVDSWHFVRYRDPEPHLRLRFHLAAATLLPDVLAALHDWSASLRAACVADRLVLDSYDPELERYGGPAAMDCAEQAFHADSTACLDQLVLLRDSKFRADPTVLLAADFLDAERRFLGADSSGGWLRTVATPLEVHEVPAHLRAQAKELLDPGGDWTHLRAEPGGERLIEIWERRAPALAAYGGLLRDLGEQAWFERGSVLSSLLHMHRIRLHGVDHRLAEHQALALARAAAFAHQRRLLHRGDVR
ncbi:lantibiotic dehydratase [Lentzea alba]|uniref:lantibiotic dehydratase n=1 Tax=Lentzea alba TaxID=2714351 RepID=UPI0039BF6B6B